MVSLTKQTERRRKIRSKNAGRARKRALSDSSTPGFPVHPEGYNPKAPDAKPKEDAG
jgi:hypothetical protein